MNLLNFLNKSTSKITKEEFINNFFKDHNHAWINSNIKYKKAFTLLLNDLKQEHIEFFNRHKTFFILCEAHLSCAIGKTQDHHLILIFPELKNLLKSASLTHGVAILAHELGHIYFQHTEKKVDILTAQLEADDFAFKLGYGEELQEVLLDHIESTDCRIRISRLTTKLLEVKYNQ
jgi:hypothetical protein